MLLLTYSEIEVIESKKQTRADSTRLRRVETTRLTKVDTTRLLRNEAMKPAKFQLSMSATVRSKRLLKVQWIMQLIWNTSPLPK
jgi:hypothetical protein